MARARLTTMKVESLFGADIPPIHGSLWKMLFQQHIKIYQHSLNKINLFLCQVNLLKILSPFWIVKNIVPSLPRDLKRPLQLVAAQDAMQDTPVAGGNGCIPGSAPDRNRLQGNPRTLVGMELAEGQQLQ